MVRQGSLLLVALMALAGCNAGFQVNTVKGKVTLDGTAISGATVAFQPVAGGTGMPAVGTTDANGIYTLTDTRDKGVGNGAAAGEYQVAIIWYKPSADDTSKATGSEAGKDDKAAHQTVTGPSALLPPRYMDAAKSGLTATVKAGANEVNFDLSSK